MKNNQNDLIFSIVFGVLGLIAAGIAYATKPEVPSIAAPPTVVTAPAALPATAVVYGNALPAGAGGGAQGPGAGSRTGSSFGPGGQPGGKPRGGVNAAGF